MATLEHALDLFVAHVRVEKGLAENTVEAYGHDLRRYVHHLEAILLHQFLVLDQDAGLEDPVGLLGIRMQAEVTGKMDGPFRPDCDMSVPMPKVGRRNSPLVSVT